MRSVLFVPATEGVAWQRLFRLAFRCQTATWGGWGNLALPLPDEGCENDELLWALLDVFDADTFHVLVPTVGELEWLAPERYRARYAERQRELMGYPKEVAAQAAEELRREALVRAELPQRVQKLLLARVAPLPGAPGTSTSGLYTDDVPPWPLTAAERLKPGPTELYVGPDFADDDLALMVAATHGELSPRLHEALTGADVRITPIDRAAGAEWASAIHPRTGAPMRELAGLGLERYAFRGGPLPGLVVCVGDDPWDFAFACALDRLGVDARWMPTRGTGDLSALHALSNFARRFQRSSELKVRLCSVSSEDALDAFAEGFADDLLKVASERCQPLDLIPVAPVRVYEDLRE
ncbi:MAG: hypothetical protein ACLP0J_19280 [Solirubrobacteraceae bacterium]